MKTHAVQIDRWRIAGKVREQTAFRQHAATKLRERTIRQHPLQLPRPMRPYLRPQPYCRPIFRQQVRLRKSSGSRRRAWINKSS